MKAIMVLCTNKRYVETMINNYPKEIKDIPFIAIIEDRILTADEKKSIIKFITKTKKIDKKKIILATTINKWFKHKTGNRNSFVDEYTMGMNIIAQAYIFDRSKKLEGILYLDDDIILSEGIRTLLDSLNKTELKSYRLSAGPKTFQEASENQRKVYTELARITYFELYYGYEKFIKNHINSGNRYISRIGFDLGSYIEKLNRFFSSDKLRKIWNDYKEHGKGKMSAWFLDQRFETMSYYEMGITSFGLNDFVMLESCKPDGLVKGKILRKPIWHNTTSSHKDAILDILKERGEIV